VDIQPHSFVIVIGIAASYNLLLSQSDLLYQRTTSAMSLGDTPRGWNKKIVKNAHQSIHASNHDPQNICLPVQQTAITTVSNTPKALGVVRRMVSGVALS